MQKRRVEAFRHRKDDQGNGMAHSVAGDGYATLRFSTEELPAASRAAILSKVLARKFVRLEIEALPDCAFHLEGVLCGMPGLGIASTFGFGVRARRTRELTADGNDDLCLGIASVGTVVVSQDVGVVTLEHGDATLISAAQPSSIVYRERSRLLMISVPAAALRPLVADISATIMRRIPRGTEALELLAAYAGSLVSEIVLESPELRHHAANYVYGLIALAVRATRAATDVGRHYSVSAARLRAIKADITDNIGRFDLSIDVVVARHGVTPRYLRKLFEAEGTTYSEFLLHQRLKRAHRLLTDPRLSNLAISAIAFESGFGDLSYFNRTFRRAFGASPTDVRPNGKSDGCFARTSLSMDPHESASRRNIDGEL
jgi:AraC-like DNA-binding protein